MMNNHRIVQIAAIIGLTAITMMPQYALQGWLATGGDPGKLPNEWWLVDAGAWALRAIVEAWVLVYLFSAQPQNEAQAKWLAVFEIALIVLITLTLGPALYAIGVREPIAQALPWPIHVAWSFGIASYAPLMLGAAGFAWRVEQTQPISNLSTPYQEIEKPIIAVTETLQTGDAAYECDECAASFATSGAYASHMRWQHPKPKTVEANGNAT